MTIASIMLAAGHGTRMKSTLPKVLHPILGKPLVLHALSAVENVVDIPPVVVIGHGAEDVKAAIQAGVKQDVQFAIQEKQLGTGHAVMCAQSLLQGKSEKVIITFADMPLLTQASIEHIIQLQQESQSVMVITTVMSEEPRGFGRVIRDSDGSVQAIVEEVDCTPEQLLIREKNTSAYCVDAKWLWQSLEKLQPSAKGEYYITDLVAMAVAEGLRVSAYVLEDRSEGLGINDRVDLADTERAMRMRVNRDWMRKGVTFIDPWTTTVHLEVELAQDVVLQPNTMLMGKTKIAKNSVIGPNTTLIDTLVGEDCHIQYSVAESAQVGNHVTIGPFARLRKGAVLQDHVHIGNFGEVKDSVLGEGTKMGHFSYIGNAEIGKDVNIGAGTITCNYDGKTKHLTEIGDSAFIGSDTMLVAPLKIGKNATTGAGSVVTRDVPDNTIVYGTPAKPKERKD